MPELEPPFRPREKLLELQKYFQNIQKHTYLKGREEGSTTCPMASARRNEGQLLPHGIYPSPMTMMVSDMASLYVFRRLCVPGICLV
ncbi:unnamed protein product [Urochloa humidicola]